VIVAGDEAEEVKKDWAGRTRYHDRKLSLDPVGSRGVMEGFGVSRGVWGMWTSQISVLERSFRGMEDRLEGLSL